MLLEICRFSDNVSTGVISSLETLQFQTKIKQWKSEDLRIFLKEIYAI